MSGTESAYEGWAILELMDHRQRAGQVREVKLAGTKVLRIDIPTSDFLTPEVTEFYGGAAIYALRPCSEEVAREAASYANILPAKRADYAYTPLAPPAAPSLSSDEIPF